jgi:hypothetical protein
MNKIIRSVSLMLLVAFTFGCLAPQAPIFAVSTTGALKIFSETKGIKVYIDEELKGTDVIEVNGLSAGDHYVKITKDEAVLYSELVKVSAGVTSAILIKTKAPTVEQVQQIQQQVTDSLYKQGQQYKQEKLDILLSKNVQTVGSATTTYNDFPGYFSFFDYATTQSSSTQYETTDWKIIQGGVQEISDRQFAALVGDTKTVAAMDKDWEDYNNLMNLGAIIGVTGIVMCLVGGIGLFADTATEGSAILFAVGVVPTIVGLGIISKNPPSGHYVNPKTASKQAFDYNQSLKKKLGLPESYEPK